MVFRKPLSAIKVEISQAQNLRSALLEMELSTPKFHPVIQLQMARRTEPLEPSRMVKRRWKRGMLGKLSRFLLNHRSDPHSTTWLSPAEFLMKRRLRTKLDLVRAHTARRVRRKQETQKKAQGHHAKDRHFEVSVPVYIRESTQGRRQR